MEVELHLGDCLDVLARLPAGSVDACVTDPPYGLGFMGKAWDTASGAWHQSWATAVLPVLKPGGYMLCFGGTRTYHRLACAVEDAGFEIRDCLMWMYGTGFPKGKGCLKPAWEPILLCRKPGPRVLPLGIDECRIPCKGGSPSIHRRKCNTAVNTEKAADSQARGALCDRRSPAKKSAPNPSDKLGRWPANVVHDGSEEVLAELAEFGEHASSGVTHQPRRSGYSGFRSDRDSGTHIQREPDSGTAARFFYCAKASRRERNAGLEGMAKKEARHFGDDACPRRNGASSGGAMTNGTGFVSPQQNTHPCVKPLKLMEWLVKLVCPTGGVVLDPFLGSGSTGVACARLGRKFIGIEKEAEYMAIAEKRIRGATVAELF